jgi:hypothetical protein
MKLWIPSFSETVDINEFNKRYGVANGKKKHTKPVDFFRLRLPFRLSQERRWVGLAVVTHSRPANLNSISPSVFIAPWRGAKLFPRVLHSFSLILRIFQSFQRVELPVTNASAFRYWTQFSYFRFSFCTIFLFTRPIKMEQSSNKSTN